ncbi:hypothetical protein RGV32_03770 [Pseudomonas sp. CCC4.1]|nr:hypothetical protein [Pseudomonas sp. CCC4.1]MDY7568963.1 hypothetical protein [Pseudomonas sp. CCC4.1]
MANPYGITCNGCGFINTPNVTLTTGKPMVGGLLAETMGGETSKPGLWRAVPTKRWLVT